MTSGAIPMGLATIITMLVYVAVPLSNGFLYYAQVLFWIDVVLSLLTCFGVPLFMIMAHEQSIDKLTAVWLLPVVAAVVASATAGNVCTVIPRDSPALQSTLIVGYVLWGIGMPFAASILVLYLHRLTVYKAYPYETDSHGSSHRMKYWLAYYCQSVRLDKVELESFNLA